MNQGSHNNYTLNNNHPLIKNSNQYFLEKKYISIHSEDRDMSKYPFSGEFEIMLPQDYLNVVSARLYSWSFPANYSVFSASTYNIVMSFRFDNLYNPGEHFVSDPLLEGIFAALYNYGQKDIVFNIEPGFYNPNQMSTELTNKFNTAVTIIIDEFFANPSAWGGNDYTVAKDSFKVYDRFRVVYNAVEQKLWFGNNADRFTLTNDSLVFTKDIVVDTFCARKNILPEWEGWGLPAYLGFTRCNATAFTGEEYIQQYPNANNQNVILFKDVIIPRFYYGDAIPDSGDNGYWILPVLPGAEVYFLQAPFKINFMGPAYMYMEIEGFNCIDETSPWNLSQFTTQTNQTNGIVRSSFAKIAIPTTPISQWFDENNAPYKYWNPPAERISKLKIKIRYHNGARVEFGLFNYSFTLELNLLKPQPERSYNIVSAYDLGQQNTFSSRYI